MSTTSTVVAFRAALLSALRAHATVVADGIQVSDAWPGPTTEDEGIWLGAVAGTSELASIKTGRQRREETYTQEVVIQCWRASTSPTDGETSVARVFALYAALEDVVAIDPDMGGVSWSSPSVFDLTPQMFEHSWAHRLTVSISCTARLT